MKLKDARSLSPLELEERRKQAVKLRERGMKYSDISEIVGKGKLQFERERVKRRG